MEDPEKIKQKEIKIQVLRLSKKDSLQIQLGFKIQSAVSAFPVEPLTDVSLRRWR